MASTIPVDPVNGAVAVADEKTFTMDHMKEHTSRESLWMLLHDKLYDVTKFMDEVGPCSWRSYGVEYGSG